MATRDNPLPSSPTATTTLLLPLIQAVALHIGMQRSVQLPLFRILSPLPLIFGEERVERNFTIRRLSTEDGDKEEGDGIKRLNMKLWW